MIMSRLDDHHGRHGQRNAEKHAEDELLKMLESEDIEYRFNTYEVCNFAPLCL